MVTHAHPHDKNGKDRETEQLAGQAISKEEGDAALNVPSKPEKRWSVA